MARIILGSTASAVVALASAAGAGADAGAGRGTCARVEASGELPRGWGEALTELQAQIARLGPTECQPMVLTLAVRPDGSGRLVATTDDGRAAERQVGRPEALVAVGLGLLMSIPATSSPTATATPASTPTPTPTATPISTPTASPTSTPPLRLSLGMEVGGRATATTTLAMIDVRLFGQLLFDHWLLGLALGGSPTAVSGAQGLDDDAFREVSAGLSVGRRIDLGAAALDVAGELSIVGMRMEYDFPSGRETTGSDLELGIGALARLDLPVTERWAFTLSVDARALPGNALSASDLELPAGETAPPGGVPQFPAWSAALRLGAMGDLLR